MRKNLGYFAIAYFICRASFIGISSVALVTLVKQDSPLSIIAGLILGIIPILLFYNIAKYKEDLNIIEKIDELFPNLKNVIKGLLMLAVFAITILNFWNLTNFVVSQFLNKTPMFVISISLIIPVIFLISKENKIIARVSLILLFFAMLLFITSIAGLSSKINPTNLCPILEYNPLKGVLSYISYNVLPIFIILIFPNKHIKKSLIYGYIFASLSLLIVIFFMISVLGIELVTIFQYPEFHILKLAFEGFVTYRLENILSIQWFFDIFILTAVGLKFCNEAFSIKKTYILPILLIILNSYLFSNNTIANKLITYVFPYIIPIFFFIIPLIIFLKIKKEVKTS